MGQSCLINLVTGIVSLQVGLITGVMSEYEGLITGVRLKIGRSYNRTYGYI